MVGQDASCYSLVVNHWVCGSYWHDRFGDLRDATVQHLEITALSVALGLVVAVPLALLARRLPRLQTFILGASTMIYTVPSLALFPLLVPFTGITETTVVIGLALYSLTILVRTILTGLQGIPEDVRESARGMGYDPMRLLLKVEFPLALPVVMAGLRVATVSTVALTTIGTIVDFGGLGNLLYDGVQNDFKAEIFAACVIVVALAFALDAVLLVAQRLMTPWARGRAAG